MYIPYQNIIDTVSKIFSCLCIFETMSAIILNPLVTIICLKSKRLRSTSTFKILAVSAVNDMLISVSWNTEMFGYTMFNYTPSANSRFYCRWFVNFLGYTTLCIETWIVLTISLDRLLGMTIKKWNKFYFAGYRPYIFTVSLCFFIAGLNFHLVFTSAYVFYDNETQTEAFWCYVTDPSYGYDWFNFATKFSLYFGFIFPVGILIIVNLLIIYKATQYSRAHKTIGNINTANVQQSERKKTQITRMILFITFLYIAVTLPEQIYTGYVYVNIIQLYIVQMMSNIINFIQFFYPSFHIFILIWSNKQFAIEIKSILSRIKGNRVGTSSPVLHQHVRPNL